MGGYIERNIFLTCIFILIIFNVTYALSLPPIQQILFITSLIVGTGVGVIGALLAVASVAGSHIAAGAFGFSIEADLDTATVKTIIGAALVLVLLFRVSVMMIPIGTGLTEPLFTIFAASSDPFANLIFLFAIIFTFVAMISGLMMAVS